MDELELEALGRKIKLIVCEETWCGLYLLTNGQVIYLGGDCLDKIVTKLLISLIPEKDRKYFAYQDMDNYIEYININYESNDLLQYL